MSSFTDLIGPFWIHFQSN